jgi:hypothetical protein
MPADDQSAAMTDEQRWAWFEAQAEEAYDKMYDANHSSDAAARYGDAQEASGRWHADRCAGCRNQALISQNRD